MKCIYILALVSICRILNAQSPALKVLIIFAHPDEGEIYAGGTTALYVRSGCSVKFLSLTNGDAGHYSMKPADLAERRYKEAMDAKQILGISEYEVLDYHDAQLKNTPEIRSKVVRIIQDWNADIVFTYYPAEGGHRDNMIAGWIVREAAPLLVMLKMPVFIYMRDYHTTSFSYTPDFAVIIDNVWEQKLAGCGAHKSQVIEANPYAMGILKEVMASKEKQEEFLFNNTYPFSKPTYDIRLNLEKWYGKNRASSAKYAEAFEIAEFGKQPDEKEIHRLFPMIGNSLTLSGTTAWIDTGIEVKENSKIEIDAEGEVIWKKDGWELCSPDGARVYTRWGNKPEIGVGTGALIGKIGVDSKDYFFIGQHLEFIPFDSGHLYIGINDDQVTDNEGEYRVWINNMIPAEK